MNLNLPEPDCTWISAGKEFESYTDMCHTLRVEPGRGSSLAAQKRMFARYFSYRKTEGRKVMITEVYDKPLPEGFSLYGLNGGGKGKYVRYIEPLLRRIAIKHIVEGDPDTSNVETFDNSGVDSVVDVSNGVSGSVDITSDTVSGVSENPRGNAICTGFTGKSCCFTKSDLLQRLGFMNENFFNKESTIRNRKDIILSRQYKAHPDAVIVKVSDINRIGKTNKAGKVKNRLIITTDDLRYFENISRLIYEKWRSAERSINNHGVIFCEPVFTLPCDGGIAEADVLQNSFVRQAEDNALAEMGIKSVKQVFIEYDYKLFYLKRNNELGKIMNSPSITVSESIKITLNESLADRVTDSSDNISEDELRFIINQMTVEDFRKRIRYCKKQYDEKRISAGDDSDDDGIWDSDDSGNGDVTDNIGVRGNIVLDGGIDSDSADSVWNVGLDSSNAENGAAIDTENVIVSAVDNNGSGESAGGNSNKSSNLRDRVLSQPDFCKKMDKLVDIFIKL